MSIVDCYGVIMSLRHAALGLLAQRPASGYDLLKMFQESMVNVWPATQSQLYGELGKLADAGLIRVSDVGPRGRKEYAITDAGREELTRWMTSPEQDPPFRSAQLLRVFLLSELGPVQAREYLESMRRFANALHAHYEQIRDSHDWSDGDQDFFGRAALENGLRFTKMQADWASWVIDQMQRRLRATQ
jgi:PadR family transcriptional regulator AphA